MDCARLTGAFERGIPFLFSSYSPRDPMWQPWGWMHLILFKPETLWKRCWPISWQQRMPELWSK